MNYLRFFVPFFVVLVLLLVLFGEGMAKEAGMFLGVVGFVILLAILIDRYRHKQHD